MIGKALALVQVAHLEPVVEQKINRVAQCHVCSLVFKKYKP
jgi:hypothetical protein